MLLVIDGEHQYCSRCIRQDGVCRSLAYFHGSGLTTDEYGMLMMNLFFHDRKVDVKDIKDIIISSVVPPLMPATLERVCLRYFNVTSHCWSWH